MMYQLRRMLAAAAVLAVPAFTWALAMGAANVWNDGSGTWDVARAVTLACSIAGVLAGAFLTLGAVAGALTAVFTGTVPRWAGPERWRTVVSLTVGLSIVGAPAIATEGTDPGWTAASPEWSVPVSSTPEAAPTAGAEVAPTAVPEELPAPATVQSGNAWAVAPAPATVQSGDGWAVAPAPSMVPEPSTGTAQADAPPVQDYRPHVAPTTPPTETPAAETPAAETPAAETPAAETPAPGTPSPDTTSIAPQPTPLPSTYVVRQGDCLWDITASYLGDGASTADVAAAWPDLYEANAAVIGPEPGLIMPGVTLEVPSGLATAAQA